MGGETPVPSCLGCGAAGGLTAWPRRVTCPVPAGLHVFPTFVLYELTVLLVLTLSVVVMKVWSRS